MTNNCTYCIHTAESLGEEPCKSCKENSNYVDANVQEFKAGGYDIEEKDTKEVSPLPAGDYTDMISSKGHTYFEPKGNIEPEDDKYLLKSDEGKTDMSLLEYFPKALEAVCRASEFGNTKYSRGSFPDVPQARRRYTAAMLRHYFQEGTEVIPSIDKEIGLPHDVMVAWNALVRLELRLRGYKLEEN